MMELIRLSLKALNVTLAVVYALAIVVHIAAVAAFVVGGLMLAGVAGGGVVFGAVLLVLGVVVSCILAYLWMVKPSREE